MTRFISKISVQHSVKSSQFSLHSRFSTFFLLLIHKHLNINFTLIPVLIFCLTACNEQIEDLLGEVEDAVSEINLDHYITLDGIDIAFKSIDGNNVYIRSNRSNITILSGSVLGDVLLEGSNCLITFEDPIRINRLDLTGSDNVINVPASSGITINSDSGSGNTLIRF